MVCSLQFSLMQDCLKDTEVDVVAGTESRGFIFGVPIAYNLHKPFVPVRKKGKLPCETVSRSMIWNMVQRRLRCTKILSSRDRKLLS